MADDAEIGRAVREYQENKTRRTQLRSRFSQMGRDFKGFGDALERQPELIQLGPGGFSISDVHRVQSPPDAVSQFNLLALGEELAELRRLEEAKHTLAGRLRALNLPIPE